MRNAIVDERVRPLRQIPSHVGMFPLTLLSNRRGQEYATKAPEGKNPIVGACVGKAPDWWPQSAANKAPEIKSSCGNLSTFYRILLGL